MCNTIIYDPICPIPNIEEMEDKNFIKMMKIGRPIEIFEWKSIPMIRKGSIKRLRDLLEFIQINEDH